MTMTPMQRDDTREDEGRADRGRVHEKMFVHQQNKRRAK